MLNDQRSALWGTSIAHAMHDGFTDLLYLMLPIWQGELGLSFSALAGLRALYAATAAGFQLPVVALSAKLDRRQVLVLGSLVTSAGYAMAGAGGVVPLCLGLVVCGLGLSTQHPASSSIITTAYGKNSREALGTYNFAGDLGKAAVPAVCSWVLSRLPWRATLQLVALAGLAITVAVGRVLGPTKPLQRALPENGGGSVKPGLALLVWIALLDSSVRMGFLTFLPFLLKFKGATLAQTGTALFLVFMGGAAGKFVCGWLGQRWGFVRAVWASEVCTALLILSVLWLPLFPVDLLLPLLGAMLNGTSSVFYGTVPDYACSERPERVFALVYTAVLGSGALSPVLYGLLADGSSPNAAVLAAACVALAVCPLATLLKGWKQ